MIIDALLCFMGEIGARFPKNQLWQIRRYFSKMIADGRVVTIYKDGKLHGVMMFAICNEYRSFWQKKTWDYVSHDPNGKTIYVEFLAARYWDKEVRTKFQEIILDRFPQIERGIWHKYASWGDRKVCWRRKCHMTSKS